EEVWASRPLPIPCSVPLTARTTTRTAWAPQLVPLPKPRGDGAGRVVTGGWRATWAGSWWGVTISQPSRYGMLQSGWAGRLAGTLHCLHNMPIWTIRACRNDPSPRPFLKMRSAFHWYGPPIRALFEYRTGIR